MIGRPMLFVVLNLLGFFVGDLVFDLEGSIAVSTLVMVFIIVYNWKKTSVNSVVMAIVYSLLFDSSLYSYTSFKLRAWYLLLVLVYFKLGVEAVTRRPRTPMTFRFIASQLPVAFLAVLSIAFLVTDPMDGRLSNIKYWLFSAGLIYVLYRSFRSITPEDRLAFLDYLVSLTVFICFWGLFQFVANILNVGERFQLDYFMISPSAFFSETTWYAIYLLVGSILIMLRHRLSPDKRLFLLLPFYIIGIIVATNRNTYVAVAVILLVNIVYFLFLGGVTYRSTLRNPYVLVAAGLFLVILAVNWTLISEYFAAIIKKFDIMNDPAGRGRLEAVALSLREIGERPLFGHGFSWNAYQVTESATYMGAKSFNLFLMILYIFGLAGFVPFFSMIVHFLVRNVLRYVRSRDVFLKYAVLVMLVFLSFSMFTPLHQYPIGMYFVALAASLAAAPPARRDMAV